MRRRWQTGAAMGAVLLAGVALAQTNVYKCVDGAHAVYQQTPCQGRAEWRWEVPKNATDAHLPASATAKETTAVASTPRRRRAMGRAQAAVITITADPAGCARARQQRITLVNGKRLDYLQRRQLDDAVRDACR